MREQQKILTMKKILLYSISAFIFFFSCKNEQKDDTNSTITKIVYPETVQQLITQVEKNPDSIKLRFSLIEAFENEGFYKEALQQLDKLITHDSLNYAFWFKKGNLQQNIKDTTNAIISFKRAVRVYPNVEALLSLANLFAETKNDTSLIICADIERMYPDRKFEADCNFITGVFYARKGNIKNALDKFDDCINSSHTYMVAYMEKGFILYENKQFKEALKIFELATKVNNQYSDAYYWMAKCYETLNKKEDAISYYEKSLTLDKNQAEASKALERLKK